MNETLVISSVMLWIVVLFNLLLTLAVIRRTNTHSTNTNQPGIRGLVAGELAPDFTAETSDGHTVGLTAYSGRPLVLVAIAPHCGPCREILPSIEALRLSAHKAGVQLILVSTEDRDNTYRMVEELSLRLPVLIAPQQSNPFMTLYRLESTPAYCQIDAHGIIQSCGHPSSMSEQWKSMVASW